MTVPFDRPPPSRRQILIARIVGSVGLLLIVLAGGSSLAAITGGSEIQTGDTYVWRSGSQLFLANNSHLEAANCTFTTGAEDRWLTIAKRPRDFFENFHTNGKWAKRFGSGPINLTCDQSVNVSSGPITWLYPIAATPWPFVAGLLMVVFWRVRRGGKYTRIFFGRGR